MPNKFVKPYIDAGNADFILNMMKGMREEKKERDKRPEFRV